LKQPEVGLVPLRRSDFVFYCAKFLVRSRNTRAFFKTHARAAQVVQPLRRHSSVGLGPRRLGDELLSQRKSPQRTSHQRGAGSRAHNGGEVPASLPTMLAAHASNGANVREIRIIGFKN